MKGVKVLEILICLLIIGSEGLSKEVKKEDGVEIIQKEGENLINDGDIQGSKNGIKIDLSKNIKIINKGKIESSGNGIFNHQSRGTKIINEGNIKGNYGIFEINEENSEILNSGIIHGMKAAIFNDDSENKKNSGGDICKNYGLFIGNDQVEDKILKNNHGTSIVLNSDGTVNYEATKKAENYNKKVFINDTSSEKNIIIKLMVIQL